MLILSRIHWFLTWAVIATILTVMVLMILRLIANQVDLNPFSWSARTIRRLTDPMIDPVRRALMGFGVNPKYAPLVTILLAVLVGWFALQLVSSLANTLAGILVSVKAAAPVATVGYLLYGMVSFYILLIFIRIIFSWGMITYRSRIMRFLVKATDPMLEPLRRIVPPLGAFDISPIVAFIILWLIQSAIAGTLLRGFQLQFFA
ncbi:MAG TPA: YggT family protein [Pyrinomonadaceae bacterium]|nr:YggT family protein [Pyrinomonadaceae bacterium]